MIQVKKILVYFILIAFSTSSLISQNQSSVTLDEAGQLATSFYKQKFSSVFKQQYTGNVETSISLTSNSGTPCIHVVNFTNGGFVLISANANAYPVLGFSTEGSFNTSDMAPSTNAWIASYIEQIEKVINENILATDNINLAWSDLRTANLLKGTKGVDPLVATKWNQDYPYNSLCPAYPGAGSANRVYAGCVATGMAQIMKYWNYPETGRDKKSYFWGETYEVDFAATTYKWDKMPRFIMDTETREAIATLIFHCAVASNMSFGTDGSSSTITNAFFALKHYFKYRSGIREVNKESMEDHEWKFLLKEDLDKKHPILYRGSDAEGNGHAFVCDGYQDTSFFHFNWGWSGSNDGFFYLDDINPRMKYFNYQGALINITPVDAVYCDKLNYDQLNWTFDDGSGPNYYFNNTHCEWQISISDTTFEKIKIIFPKFNVLDNDYLYLYAGTNRDAELIGKYNNSNRPSELYSTSKDILVVFETDGTGQADGWEIMYQSIVLGVDNNIATNNKISLYPNPADSQITLNNIDNNSQITIFDLCGKKLLEIKNPSNNNIDVSQLKKGIYFIEVNTNNVKNTLKFVKK